MPSESSESQRSPVGRRPRSQSPIDRRKRAVTADAAETFSRKNKEARDSSSGASFPRHHQSLAESLLNTKSPKRSRSVSKGKGDRNALQDLDARSAQILSEHQFQKRETNELKRKNEKFNEENSRLLKENESLCQDVRTLQAETSRWEADCNALKARLTALERSRAPATHAEPRASLWGLTGLFSHSQADQKPQEQLIATLQAELSRWEKLAQKLQVANDNLKHETANLESQLQRQTASFTEELELITSQQHIKLPDTSDSEIQQKWKSLAFSVEQFVSIHLPELLDHSTVQRLANLSDFNWLPEISKTSQTPLLCPVVFESWIWHFLCFRIFDVHSEFWAGGIGKSFSGLCDKLQGTVSVQKFHEWRVRTTHFILHHGPRDPNRPARFAGDMLNSFKHLMPQGNESRVSHKMYQDALDMVHKAAELDTIFRLSKAHFHVFITRLKMPLVEPPKLGFAFDPDTMERVKSVGVDHWRNSIPIVDLAVSPGIFKAGNSSGSSYHSERVLVKLRALCNLQAAFAYLGIHEVKVEATGERQPKIKDEEDCDVDMLEVV